MSALKDPRRHDDLLNFQLKRLVTLAGAPAIRLCEGGFGVTRQEWRMTAALVESGPHTARELALRTGWDPGRVSRTIAALADKGLVERRADEGRRVRVAATEQGQALYRDLFPHLAGINRRLMEALGEEEAAVLEELLARLWKQAQAIHAEGGGVSLKTGRHLGSRRRVPAFRSLA